MFYNSFIKPLAVGLTCCSLLQSTSGFPTLQERESNTATPRNVMYVQTFIDPSGNWYNLTDLIPSGITHVILASLHLDSPTQIHLNDNDITSSYWDPLWPMVASLQAAGVKVCLMMGGAALGSWANIATDVWFCFLILVGYKANNSPCSLTPTTRKSCQSFRHLTWMALILTSKRTSPSRH